MKGEKLLVSRACTISCETFYILEASDTTPQLRLVRRHPVERFSPIICASLQLILRSLHGGVSLLFQAISMDSTSASTITWLSAGGAFFGEVPCLTPRQETHVVEPHRQNVRIKMVGPDSALYHGSYTASLVGNGLSESSSKDRLVKLSQR